MATGLQCLYYIDFETKFEEEEAHLAFLEWHEHLTAYLGTQNITLLPKQVEILKLQGGKTIREHYKALVVDETWDSIKERIVLSIKPVVGSAYIKLKLSNTKQQKSELMEKYISRLDRIISLSSITDVNIIKDLKISTITINCNSLMMQKFILSKGDTITIKQIVDESRLQEQVERESKLINQIKINQFTVEADINSISLNKSKCRNCDRVHDAGKCPAYGKPCHKCQQLNHFAISCTAPTPLMRNNQYGQQQQFNRPKFPTSYQQPQFQSRSNRNYPSRHYVSNIDEQVNDRINPIFSQFSQHSPYNQNNLTANKQHYNHNLHYNPQYNHNQQYNHQYDNQYNQLEQLNNYQTNMHKLSQNESSDLNGRPTNSGYYC